MTIVIGLFTEEYPDGYVRVFRSEDFFPKVEELAGKVFVDGGVVSVPGQCCKSPSCIRMILISIWFGQGVACTDRVTLREFRGI